MNSRLLLFDPNLLCVTQFRSLRLRGFFHQSLWLDAPIEKQRLYKRLPFSALACFLSASTYVCLHTSASRRPTRIGSD